MVLLTAFFAVATWLEEKERQRRLRQYFSLVILVTWLETLRRQMLWEDHLADIYEEPQPAEPFPVAEAA